MRTDLSLAPYRDFDYPRLVAEPAGGVWTPGPDTFRVEEVPLYPFGGQGEHAALWVERAGRSTRDLAVAVARRLGVGPAAVGYAGMKDKRCTAVQGFTVTGVPTEAARAAFEAEGARVLTATRHRNKLRLGHLAANRFRVVVEGADPAAVERVLTILRSWGVPNYFGPQRFGARGDNALQGARVLRGEVRTGRWKRDLLVSALQSAVFNEVLARRLEAGTLDRPLQGDVLRKADSGGLFVCTDPRAEAGRVERFEVAPTGPLWGRKMVRPVGEVAREEARVLAAFGLEEDLFVRQAGARRPLRIPLAGVEVRPLGTATEVEFLCPPGTFATSVVREITGAPAGFTLDRGRNRGE